MKITVRTCRVCGEHKDVSKHFTYSANREEGKNRDSWCNDCCHQYYKLGKGPEWRESMVAKWADRKKSIDRRNTDFIVHV